jgi:RHS repeat-associated protein
MSGYSFTVPTTGYDDEDRLVDFDGAADQVDQSWNLSLVGDWDSVTTDSTTQNRTHGPTHELLTAGGSSVAHDAKGNMTSIPANLRDSSDPLALNWDFDNRMKSADTDNDSAADVFYEFDALGRRVARDDGTQDTIFVQVGQQTIADYVSGTAAASPEYIYAWGSYIDELILRTEPSGTDLHYHRNQQYSTYAVTNSTGAIQERYAYSPYGELTITDASGTTRSASTMDSRYTYTGREWDADLGLYHFRARMYDAGVGRFCSRDPLKYNGGQWLVYGFVQAQPLSSSDPFGLHPAIAGCGFGAIGGAIGQLSVEFLSGNMVTDPKGSCCNTIMSGVGGCVSGAISASVPYIGPCVGPAVGGLVTSLLQNQVCKTRGPIGMCDLKIALVNMVLGCVGGALEATEVKHKAKIIAGMLGVNVSTWSSVCNGGGCSATTRFPH